MKRLIHLFLALSLVVVFLAGCGGTATPTGAGDGGAAAGNSGENNAGGDNFDADLVLTQATDMIHWDPIASSDMPNSTILFTIYSRLFKSDKDFKPVPELCEEATMVSPTEWHFKIYENIICHDGVSVITADDVLFNLNRAAEGVTLGALFRPVTGMSKVDDLTISITTDGPYPGLMTALSHVATSILPQSYVEQAVANDDWSSPIGSGRYKFDSRIIGDSVKVVRFDDYFNADDRAQNHSLTFKIIPEGTSRTIAVETGEVDLNIDFETNDYDRVVNNPDLKLWEEPTTQTYYLAMDVTLPWLDNKLVRQAVNFAVDRESCLQVALNGRGYVLYNTSNFASTVLGGINNPLDYYSFDPDRAKELMDEAGCTGFDTEIYVYTEISERVAQVVQGNLAEIGINATVHRVESAVLYARTLEHQTPMFIDTWACYWDPDLFLVRRFTEAGFGGVNRSWYSSPEMDRLLVEGRQSAVDEERAEVYRRIQEFMVFEAPQADLFVNNAFALTRAGLKGVIVGSERVSYLDQLHY
ncbi:MAG: ABC transporter substrate-binding protein [Oscillospiraceae bacterium]|nr:ABC transporter substrate-binding protein [Oscillospiraceae bacterium]